MLPINNAHIIVLKSQIDALVWHLKHSEMINREEKLVKIQE